MGAAQTEAFNHITSGTGPSPPSSSGSSFVLKEVDRQEDSRGDKRNGDPSPISMQSDSQKRLIPQHQQNINPDKNKTHYRVHKI